MDWLRIGAFALLILYHVGMVFVPWDYHVKSPNGAVWVTFPMLASNAWRLTLLFVVSGYASRALWMRSAGTGAFLGNRTLRLLVPLAFGMAVIVPPQAWVELTTKYGYARGYIPFWIHDYFTFRRVGTVGLPTWNHLWFVAYLWLYTMLLGCVLLLVRSPRAQAAFDRIFAGWGVIVWPTAWMIAIHSWWFPMAQETHALIGDWVAHAMYLPAFLFGFALARSEPAMAAIARLWKAAAAIALAGYGAVLAVAILWPGTIPAPRWIYPPYGAAHALQQWGTIVALIGIAERFWNHDRPIRSVLTEAVFPFYIIHQTIIVVVMFWLLGKGLSGGAEFAILVAATTLGCLAFYYVGRAIPPLRPLIGLRMRTGRRG